MFGLDEEEDRCTPRRAREAEGVSSSTGAESFFCTAIASAWLSSMISTLLASAFVTSGLVCKKSTSASTTISEADFFGVAVSAFLELTCNAVVDIFRISFGRDLVDDVDWHGVSSATGEGLVAGRAGVRFLVPTCNAVVDIPLINLGRDLTDVLDCDGVTS